MNLQTNPQNLSPAESLNPLGTSPFNSMVMTAAFVAIGLPATHMPFVTAILSAAYKQEKPTFEMADCYLTRYIPGDPFANATRKQRTNHANYERRKLRDWQEATGIEIIKIRPGFATLDGLKFSTRYKVHFIDFLKEIESRVSFGMSEDKIRKIANEVAYKFRWHRDQWKHRIKKEKPEMPLENKLKTARTQAMGAISRIKNLTENDPAKGDHLLNEIKRRLDSHNILSQAAGIPVEEPLAPLDAIDALMDSLTEMVASLSPTDQVAARNIAAEKGIILADESEWDSEKVAAYMQQAFDRAENFGYKGKPSDFPSFHLDCNQTAGLVNSVAELREAVQKQMDFCGNYFEAEDHILSARAAECTDSIPSFGYTRRHNGVTLEKWLAEQHGLSTELIQ